MLIGRRERFEPGTGEHKLWLNIGGSAGHSSMWAVDIVEGAYDADRVRKWDVDVQTASSARRTQEDEAERRRNEKTRQTEEEWKRKVWAVLERHPNGETKSVLSQQSGVNLNNTGRGLELLDVEGRLEVSEMGHIQGTNQSTHTNPDNLRQTQTDSKLSELSG